MADCIEFFRLHDFSTRGGSKSSNLLNFFDYSTRGRVLMVNFLEFFLLFDQRGGGKGVKGWVTAGAKIHGTSVRYITSDVVGKNGDIFHF